jgi:hypothetical protein
MVNGSAFFNSGLETASGQDVYFGAAARMIGDLTGVQWKQAYAGTTPYFGWNTNALWINGDLRPSGTIYGGSQTNSGAIAATAFYGNGSGLTNLSPANIVSGTFTGQNNFPNLNMPTNTPTDAYVLTATGTSGATAWKASAASSGGWVKETWFGGIVNAPLATGNSYASVAGVNGAQTFTAISANQLTPTSGYISNLVVYTSVSWPSGTNCVLTVMTNGVDSAMTVGLNPSLNGTFTNTATSVQFYNYGTNVMRMKMNVTSPGGALTAQALNWMCEYWHQ